MKHAKRMRPVMSPVACVAIPYFSTLSNKQHDCQEKVTEHKILFVFYLQLLSETFLILRRIQRHIFINVHTSACKVPLFLPYFDETCIFSKDYRKILISCFMKIRPGSSIVPCERTEMAELIVAFRHFSNAP
jgi:hypothetical protein